MRPVVFLCALSCAIGHIRSVGAYELATHGALSKRAFAGSSWAKGPGPASIGLDSNKPFPSLESGSETPIALIELGSQHEDDGSRPINHFYDPYYDKGLWVPSAKASPDWALEDSIVLSSQAFSYRRLFDYFRFALSRPSASQRDQYWGQLFEGLGHVVHHIQDMAQPQHVRNDSHYHKELFGDPSEYEFCTNRSVQNVPNGCGTPLLTPDYPVVALPRARDYWTTRSVDAFGRRRGLADFTNANFVSKDSNFRLLHGNVVLRGADYPKPVPASSRTRTLEELGAADICERLRRDPRVFGAAADCEIEFFATEIYDAYTGESGVNERAASLSIFDQYLKLRPSGSSYETDRFFTLNRFNYAAAHPYLISRAIGYSAGLIDHFFRGRLELSKAEADADSVRLEIKNVSDADNAFGPGTFEIYYDSASGSRRSLLIEEGENLGMAQLAPDAIHTLRFTLPDDVDLKSEKPFVVVYTGIIGAEEAVTGLVLAIPGIYEGFLFGTSATPDGVAGPRLLYQRKGQWKLHPQGGFQSGRVDWMGRYRNGKPTRVLSWNGTRYLADTSLGYEIYQDGKLLALAPGRVLGAALYEDSSAKEWLIAVCQNAAGTSDVVYRRPATYSNKASNIWSETNPDGWKEIGSFPNPPELEPRPRPWLFNGAGTEAQTMRELKRTDLLGKYQQPLVRLKVVTDGSSASFSNLGNTQVIRKETYDRRWPPCPNNGDMSDIEIRHKIVITGENVVAVDYRDDVEILARVAVDSVRESAKVGAWSRLAEAHSSISYPMSHKATWTLTFGSAHLPLLEVTESGTGEESSDRQIYRYSRSKNVSQEGAKLLAMDLRTDTVLARYTHFESSETEADENGSRTFTISSSSHHRHLVRAANAVDHTTGPVASVTNPPVTAPTDRYIVDWCSGDSEAHDDREESVLAAPENVHLYARAAPGGFVQAAAANDRVGNTFVSLRYWDDVSTPGTPIDFSFLSDGDPVSATGVDPSQAAFFDIRPK